MSKLPTTPNNLKQPSPDNNGLGKHQQQSTDVDTQAAHVNRDTAKLEKSATSKTHTSKAKSTNH